MSSFIRLAQIILVLTLVIGFYTTWYLSYNNGTVELMREIRDHEPQILPGTKAPLKKAYVGVGWMDYQLTVLTLFFWETVDGSRPAASLFNFMFAGQAAAAWSVLYIEGRRRGNRWRLQSFVMCWVLAIQIGTFAVFMPLYLILHLATSPTVSSTRVVDYAVEVENLMGIPLSITVGYAIPAVLLSLPAPSILTYGQKQSFIAIWQVFPIWLELLQQVFSFLAKFWIPSSNSETTSQIGHRRTLKALRSVYVFVIVIAGVTRITTVMLSLTSKLFPAIFAPEYRGVLDPTNVFVVQSFSVSTKMNSIGAGASQLLLYDEMIGSGALLFWSVVLYLKAYTRTKTIHAWAMVKIISAFLASIALFGSCGSSVCFTWARDELVFAEEEYAKKSN